jgi:hypothetical protein
MSFYPEFRQQPFDANGALNPNPGAPFMTAPSS